MPRFGYYSRLSARQKAIYRASDERPEVPLSRAGELRETLETIEEALGAADQPRVVAATRTLVTGMVERLGVPPVTVKVYAARPSASWGELHGLYEPAEGRAPARLSVWMRTARRRQVVAFRTYLRTVLHELCHHLDYELLGLADSFHTQGFFQRESSLFHQLMDSQAARPASARR